MPRPLKPPRLYLERAEVKNGRVTRPATWRIKHAGQSIRTNIPEADREAAEQKLREYIASLPPDLSGVADLAALIARIERDLALAKKELAALLAARDEYERRMGFLRTGDGDEGHGDEGR